MSLAMRSSYWDFRVVHSLRAVLLCVAYLSLERGYRNLTVVGLHRRDRAPEF